jgi:putative ABC transport system permease protein
MLAEIGRRLLILLRRRQFDADLQEEMRLHRELREQGEIDRGLTPEEARYAASRRFGNPLALREESREMWGWNWLEHLVQDVRYGLRRLAKNPGFALAAGVALALGIGADAAIFTIVDATMIKPLPYRNANRLVWACTSQAGDPCDNVSGPDFLDWRDQNHVFDGMAAEQLTAANLAGISEPEMVDGWKVTGNMLSLLGVEPILGRGFLPEEEKPGHDHVVILGYGLWQRAFGADGSVIGRTVKLDSEPYQVIGVMPARLYYPTLGSLVREEYWIPLRLERNDRLRSDRNAHVLARLGPGVTLARAQAEMEIIAARLAQKYPETNARIGARVISLQDEVTRTVRPFLLLLFGTVGLVLLISCANVANLSLVQAGRRERELAVRTALGASRSRLVGQLLLESLLLALLGGGAGLALAVWGEKLLLAASPPLRIPEVNPVTINLEVLGFVFFISVLAALLSGLVPAIEASHPNLNRVLKEGIWRLRGSHRRLHSGLILSEMAIGAAGLTVAALFVRSLVKLEATPIGFDPRGVLTLQLSLPKMSYPDPQRLSAFYRELTERVQALPGAESVALTNRLPMEWPDNDPVRIEGKVPPPPSSEYDYVEEYTVTPGYLRLMGIPLLKGRDFTPADDMGSPRVAIINKTMAHRFWPGEDPLGKRFAWENPGEAVVWRVVVGVTGDVPQGSLEMLPRPAAYLPMMQAPAQWSSLVVRTKADPRTMVRAVIGALHSVDKELPASGVATLDELVSEWTGDRRFDTLLVSLLALIGMLLGAVGVYSVVAHSVSQRTHEIGVRMALGARPQDVLAPIFGEVLPWILAGAVVGMGAAVASGRLIASQLYQVRASDPWALLLACAALTGVALLATYIPARRATKVDPMAALRFE